MKAVTANKKSYVYIPLIILIAVIWFIILMKAFSRLGLNSDMAGMVIEANEILSGNFFLRGREFTGLTFLPTDLLFFIIGALFFGISGKTYIMALVLMYAASASAVMLIMYDIYIYKQKNNYLLNILIFLTLSGFPVPFLATINSGHQGGFAWCLYAVYFLNKVVLKKGTKKKKLQYYTAAAIFMTMACAGDTLSYVAVIIPIIAFSVIKIFCWLYKGRKEKLDSFYWISMASAIGSAILGKLLTAIYIAIGGAHLNAYTGNHKFIDLYQLRDKFIIFIDGILYMFNAHFAGGTVSSADTLIALVKCFAVLAVVAAGYIYSVKYCIKADISVGNYASVILGIGFLIISVLMLLTDFSVNIHTSRYFCYLPFVMTVWLLTWLSKCKFIINKIGRALLVILCLIFVIQDARGLIFDSSGKWFTFQPAPSCQEEVVDRIEEMGLKNGYSDYWNANYSTVQSGGRIKVNSVENDGASASVMYWFSNSDDYKEYANFVIAGENFPPDTVQNIFGTPQSVEEVAGSRIMVYDYDLSKAIQFKDENDNYSSQMEKENIYTCLSFKDACHNEKAYNENGTRFLTKGGLSFGPYISLDAGTYEVEIIGSNLENAVYTAYTTNSDGYMIDTVELNENKGVFKVHVNAPAESFEFCIRNASDELIEIRRMFIR